MKVYVESVGLCGPGLDNWPLGRAILAGKAPHQPADVRLIPSELLPQAERRRMTDAVKLSIAVAGEAINASSVKHPDMPSVFTSSGGDGATIISILDILASPEREVSPTRFHNSVHNAPSGYWSIATQSRGASTSLCGYDYSFGVGLVDAAAQAVYDQTPILLVCYDLPYPAPIHRFRSIESVFGVAFVLSPQPSDTSLALLDLKIIQGGEATTMRDPYLEVLRAGNPAARSLPLLETLAESAERQLLIPYVAQNLLEISLSPC